MRQTLLTRLPRAPRILAPVSGSNALAVVDEDGACFIVPPVGPLPSPPPVVYQHGSPMVGAGGWGRHAHFVSGGGRFVTVELDTGRMTNRGMPPCDTWVAASHARRSARIISNGGSYRSDHVQVWDEERGVKLADVVPDTRDCFQVDHVALDAEGEHVALTGLDVCYTSEGDWNWGQNEVLTITHVPSGRTLLDVVLGETDRPSEHAPIPTVLTGGHCFAAGRFFSRPSGGEALGRAERIPLGDEEPQFDRVCLLAPLQGGRVAVIRDDSREVLILATPGTAIIDVEELPAPAVALTRLGKGLVAGLADGSLVLLT